jgi:hypothetical protein
LQPGHEAKVVDKDDVAVGSLVEDMETSASKFGRFDVVKSEDD